MDKARIQTDKQLNDTERKIKKVYSNNLALRRIEKKYQAYMESVQKRTEASYKAYMAESDREKRAELKEAYVEQVKALTTKSSEYNKLMNEITTVLADVNQEAVDVINDEMEKVYIVNYNQLAEDCKKAGITVNDGRRKKETK